MNGEGIAPGQGGAPRDHTGSRHTSPAREPRPKRTQQKTRRSVSIIRASNGLENLAPNRACFFGVLPRLKAPCIAGVDPAPRPSLFRAGNAWTGCGLPQAIPAWSPMISRRARAQPGALCASGHFECPLHTIFVRSPKQWRLGVLGAQQEPNPARGGQNIK